MKKTSIIWNFSVCYNRTFQRASKRELERSEGEKDEQKQCDLSIAQTIRKTNNNNGTMQPVGGQIIRGQIQTVNKTTMSIQTVTQNITNPISAIAWFMLLNPIISSHSIHTTPSLYSSLSGLASLYCCFILFILFYFLFKIIELFAVNAIDVGYRIFCVSPFRMRVHFGWFSVEKWKHNNNVFYTKHLWMHLCCIFQCQ